VHLYNVNNGIHTYNGLLPTLVAEYFEVIIGVGHGSGLVHTRIGSQTILNCAGRFGSGNCIGSAVNQSSILRPCQHDDGYINGRTQIKVHTDERTQVHSARSSLAVAHPSTNRGRCCLTSVNVPLCKVLQYHLTYLYIAILLFASPSVSVHVCPCSMPTACYYQRILTIHTPTVNAWYTNTVVD